MNRERRRRLSRGRKKTATLAGVSLAAASGLFGAYLGNGRIPNAYAAVTCGTTGTYNIASQSDWITAVASINANNVPNPTRNCFELNITSDFTVTQDLEISHRIDLSTNASPPKISLIGNGKTISGSGSTASFMHVRLPGFNPGDLSGEVHISDLTITGMEKSAGTAVANIWSGQREGLAKVYMDNVHVTNNRAGYGWGGQGSIVYVRGEVHISDSTFIGNSKVWTDYAYAGALFLYEGANNTQSTISNSVFSNNTASAQVRAGLGGAIAFLGYKDSALTIESSTFDGNSVSAANQDASRNWNGAHGGAIFASAPLVIRDSVFTDNSATGQVRGTGGAVSSAVLNPGGWLNGASIKVYNSAFSDNDVSITTATGGARVYGGAIGGGESTTSSSTTPLGGLQLTASTFSGNEAHSDVPADAAGGAIGFRSLGTPTPAPMSVVNSTFSGNSADDSGGGLFAQGAPLSVDFSTFTGNSAVDGGGIFSVADDTVTNSLVSLNTASGSGADVKSGGTTVSDHSLFTSAGAVAGTFTQGPGTLFSSSAQVGALGDNGGTAIGVPGATQTIRTMLPLSGSMVLGAGTVSPASGVLPATDERGPGFPRVTAGSTTMGAVQGVAAPPTPPPPAPVFPPSAPRDVVGVPGDGEVAVSWREPADAGSFPVTDYLVTAGPGGRTCLAKAPALTCTVTGLENGTAYTFVVKALNGAGWGPTGGPSEPVTPSAKARSLTLFQGKRAADGRHDRITTGGTSVGVPAGVKLTPWIRYGDTGAFKEGAATIVVDARGNFTWTRQIRKDKKFVAYVAYEDLESNRVVWQRVR